eukprot:CAMPEP_0113592498 /NCGR_PEP_ID=MMETSP0015_2-20120614/37878_1 /TAXON_ID=2838 /ORGANISM="Odontella" /LENGTH=1256 /DNA_ID=CAMNT_0000499037 /DNA_START=186 /DNA_END=3956 /DNA_ORIENTATION=+ /assembly_acc=CAM_ASM_000160
MSSTRKGKAKLRTASDVISRLRWSVDASIDFGSDRVIIGYDDRINGPMEKPVDDFVSACKGGDIPEHRILYFRRSANPPSENGPDDIGDIVWDRLARRDIIFGSGHGASCPAAPDTLLAARTAICTMRRLEEEREMRRRLKEKERARRMRKRANINIEQVGLTNSNGCNATAVKTTERFAWKPIPSYVFSSQTGRWEEQVAGAGGDTNAESSTCDKREFSCVTWNVLFDLYDRGIVGDEMNHQSETNSGRWKALCSVLQKEGSDIICLQEVTPNFLDILANEDWVKNDYTLTAAPSAAATVDPCGVLLLWHKHALKALSRNCGVFGCSDGGRNRSVAAALVNQQVPLADNHPILVGVAHLPADRASQSGGLYQEKGLSRYIARRRELCAIVGQIERMEMHVSRSTEGTCRATPIIAGDFNCGDEELLDGSFSGIAAGRVAKFQDVWGHCGSSHGMTFDPSCNPRAARSSTLVGKEQNPRRIDRIYVAGGTKAPLTLYSANLVGQTSPPALPPSDHFGVKVIFRREDSSSKNMRGTGYMMMHSWAAASSPSPDFLLAFTFYGQDILALKDEHNSTSSCAAPHLTLLHGFAEISHGCEGLVDRAIRDAVAVAGCTPNAPPLLTFSLDVFEHRASASLVAIPDDRSSGGSWLRRFHGALSKIFCLCQEQERHNQNGWNPHVKLGSFGSSVAARAALSMWEATNKWPTDGRFIQLQHVDVLQRGNDGRFRTIRTIPLTNITPFRGIRCFSSDTCSLLESVSKGASELVSIASAQIGHACRAAATELFDGLLGVEVIVEPFGSTRLGVALPPLSDIDLVAKIEVPQTDAESNTTTPPFQPTQFLERVGSELQKMMPRVKCRIRPAGRDSFPILTMRNLIRNSSIDLALCQKRNGQAIGPRSKTALLAIEDADYILEAIGECGLGMLGVEVYRKSLRTLKCWAHNRYVYGANMGYLGGGGWAVFLGRIMIDLIQNESAFSDIRALSRGEDDADFLVSYITLMFFIQASRWDWSDAVTINSEFARDQKSLSETNSDADADGANHMVTLTVLSPCSGGNFGGTSTMSTKAAIGEELRRAAIIAQGVDFRNRSAHILALNAIVSLCSTREFIESYSHILALEVSYERAMVAKPAHLKAWGCSRIITLLVDVERRLGATSGIRLRPEVLQLKKDWQAETALPMEQNSGFLWLFGLSNLEDLAPVITRLEPGFNSDAQRAFAELISNPRGGGGGETLECGRNHASSPAVRCKFHVLESEDASACLVL